MYMGHTDNDDPNHIVFQNHRILSSLHSGRLFSYQTVKPQLDFIIFVELLVLIWVFFGFCFFIFCSVEEAKSAHLYSYKHGFKGFAAKLTEDQALQIASKFKFLVNSYFFL